MHDSHPNPLANPVGDFHAGFRSRRRRHWGIFIPPDDRAASLRQLAHTSLYIILRAFLACIKEACAAHQVWEALSP